MDKDLAKLKAKERELEDFTFGKKLIGNHTISDINKKLTKFKSKHTPFGEKVLIAVLEENNIYYKVEHVFDDSKKRFDIYLPRGVDNTSEPFVIEVNGKQHYEDSSLFSRSKTATSDKYKEDYCNTHGISIVFLDCSKSSFKHVGDSILSNEVLSPLIEGTKLRNIYRKYFNKDFRELSRQEAKKSYYPH